MPRCERPGRDYTVRTPIWRGQNDKVAEAEATVATATSEEELAKAAPAITGLVLH